jgi:cytochrome c biogenesis protein CcmG/thiol:disulfide interchange protein DsbE
VSARVVGALAALLLALTGCSASSSPQGGQDDAPARLPKVTLDALGAGEPLDLSTVRGPAVVNLWASWCGPCRDELPLYQDYAQKHSGKVDVIGIDFQDTQVGKARQLIRDTGVTYPLYQDPDGVMRARGLPQVILLDEQGRRVFEKYVEITSVAQLEQLVEQHLGVS